MHIFIMDMMNSFGYIGIALLIMIENLFPPIPSEVILTFGGFMTTYTRLTVGGVVFFSTLGSTVGAIFLYYIGKLPEVHFGTLFSSQPALLPEPPGKNFWK